MVRQPQSWLIFDVGQNENMQAIARSSEHDAARIRVTTLLLVVFWLPYSFSLFGRIVFMVHEGGMEWRDGTGSPFLFVIGMVTEFIVLGIPAALLSGMTLILRAKQKPNKSPEPTPTSVMPAAEQPSRRP